MRARRTFLVMEWLTLVWVGATMGTAGAQGPGGPDSPLTIPHILRLPALADLALAPDGKRVAVSALYLGVESILVLSDPDQPGKVVAASEGRDREPDWSPDGSQIAFVSDRDGSSRSHIFLARPDDEEARQLTDHQGEDKRPRFSPDGSHIAYLSRRLATETGWDLWIIPSTGGKARRLTDDPLDEADPRWSPDGKWIAYTLRAGHHVNRSVAVVAGSSEGLAEPREVLPESWQGDSHSARWSPDGGKLAFVSDHGGVKNIFLVPATGGEPEPLLQSEFEETEPAWSPDGTEIAHITNREGNLRLTLTAVSPRKSRLLTLGSGVYAEPQWSPDGETVVSFYEGPVYPRDVWFFNKGGGRSRLSETLPPEVDPRQMIRPELVRFQSFDDRTITGFLYVPLDASPENPASLIVRPHGGPTSQWRNGWHPFEQLLAQQGIAVFAPNVRGSSGFGLEFENLNDRDWGRGDLEDLVAGTRTVVARPEIRSDRIAIWGVSYGGFLTLAAIGRYPDLFVCAVEAVGMPDLEKLYRETNQVGRNYLEREIGPLRGNLSLYRELSPVRNVEKIKTPLVTFHGQDYPLVPYTTTKLPFLRALNRPNYPLMEYLIKGDHVQATYRYALYPGSTRFYLEKILEFLLVYL